MSNTLNPTALQTQEEGAKERRLTVSKAEITPDALLTYISDHPVDHPSGVPAYTIRWFAPLVNGQSQLADHLIADPQAGSITSVARSSIAQLGLELEFDQHKRIGNFLQAEGHLLSVAGDQSDRLIQHIHAFMREQHGVVLGRTALLTKESRVKHMRTYRRQIKKGGLRVNGASRAKDGSLLLPLGNHQYVFKDGQPSDELLDTIVSGRQSGREALNQARTKQLRTDVLQPGAFIVTDIHVETRHHHVMLRRETRDLLGSTTEARHLIAFLLEAGRTQGGERHAEVWNMGKEPINLSALRILADMHYPAEVIEQGA